MDSVHLQFLARHYCAANGIEESRLSLTPVQYRINQGDVIIRLDAVHILINEEIDTDLFAAIDIDSEYGKLLTNPIHYRYLPAAGRMVQLSGTMSIRTKPAFQGVLFVKPYDLHFIRLTLK